MIKRAVRILLGSLLIGIGLFWAAGTFLLEGLVRDQVRFFGEKIGYEISIGEFSVSPLLFQARVNDIRISPRVATEGALPLFTLKQLDVDARFWPLLKGDVTLKKVALESPEILVARSARQWNWQTFIDEVNEATAPDTSASETPSSMQIRVDALLIDGARLAIRDAQKKAAYDFGPFSLHLTELSNQNAAAPKEVGLSSKYVLNLGRVAIPLPKVAGVPDRQLAFRQVTATGYLIENAASDMKVRLDLVLDDGKITSTWQMSSKGALSGDIHLADLAVQPLLALAPSYEPLYSPSGVIEGDVFLKQDSDALTVDADLKVDELDIRVRDSKEPLLSWASTTLNKFHLILPMAEHKAGLLTINDVLVDRPKIRFVMDSQSQSNFRSLFSKPEAKVLTAEKSDVPAAPSDSTVKVVAKTTQATPEFRYDVRSVRLKSGAMHFSDEAIKPVFRVDVTDLNGSIQGISNEPNRYASLVLNGRAAKTGSLRARGQLAFADPRQNNDVSLIFRNIPLNATNPYTMTFAGYAIDDGRIDVDLRYVTKNGALEGKNRFVIKKIKLGDPVADYEGTRLPLGLAIALLEDSDGMIDVNIPVKGNVNEPEFSVGHLVWQAVKTVLSNVVTAPFRALGALLGIENVDAIAFVPGESALPPDGEEQLVRIAEFLAKRPKSMLVIHGTYDPKVDADELARAMADQAILEASGIKVVAGEPLPLPNLTDPKVKAGLKTAYGAQVGRIKLGQRLLTLPDNEDRDTQLRQELIQSYKISDEQLNHLATRRAEAVKAKIQSVDGKLADRITIGDNQIVSADEAGIPIRVELVTGG
ncbi:MAG: hypothetical protein RL651_790 [Pseudomonadota bacterium]|jgi:hypothetical protein